MAAEGGQTGDDVIARLDVNDVAAHGFHHAGGLMAQDGGQGIRVGAVLKMQIGVTHACSHGAHEHLSGPWLAVLDVLDFQRFVDLAQYGGFHTFSP